MANIDTSTLAVGQKVWMQSGDELTEGKVVSITEKYITVELDAEAVLDTVIPLLRSDGSRVCAYRGSGCRYFPLFDKNGKQPEGDDFKISFCGKDGEPYVLAVPPKGKEPR
jgi:hypothetical protein